MDKRNRYLWSEMFRFTLQGKAAWAGIVLVLPWIIGALLFFVYPLLNTLRLSVSEITNLNTMSMKYVGLKWYVDTVTADVMFLPSMLKVSVKNLVNLPLLNVFSLIIAIMLSRDIRFRGFYRTMFFLPVLLGTGFIMQQLLGQKVDGEAMSYARGLLLSEQIISYIGPAGATWIQNFLNNITTILWTSGLPIVIYLSGLQSVPSTIYEAARVDSANEWEIFWLITLPMMAPIIQLNLVFSVIYTFSMSDNDILEFIGWLAFQSNDKYGYEYSSAVSWIYCIFILCIVGVLFLLTRRFVNNVKEGEAN